MGKRLLLILLIFLVISSQAIANQCNYKTETITENGVVVISTKEIKVCEETTYISGGFWNDLMHSEQGNELFWNTLISNLQPIRRII